MVSQISAAFISATESNLGEKIAICCRDGEGFYGGTLLFYQLVPEAQDVCLAQRVNPRMIWL